MKHPYASRVVPSVKERLRMALAEAGWTNVNINGPDDDPCVTIFPSAGGVPDDVCWKAFRVALNESKPCYSCYNNGYGEECYEGDCHAV